MSWWVGCDVIWAFWRVGNRGRLPVSEANRSGEGVGPSVRPKQGNIMGQGNGGRGPRRNQIHKAVCLFLEIFGFGEGWKTGERSER